MPPSFFLQAVEHQCQLFAITAAPTSYSTFHIVGDLVGLLDAVTANQDKVFVVGHYWRAAGCHNHPPHCRCMRCCCRC